MRVILTRMLLGFAAVVLVLSGLSLSAHAVTDMELLEVTGTLERVEPGEEGTEILTLNVNGKEASAPLDPGCRFMDEGGESIEKNDFLRRYMKRLVTLELEAKSGAVMSCRVGS